MNLVGIRPSQAQLPGAPAISTPLGEPDAHGAPLGSCQPMDQSALILAGSAYPLVI